MLNYLVVDIKPATDVDLSQRVAYLYQRETEREHKEKVDDRRVKMTANSQVYSALTVVVQKSWLPPVLTVIYV